MPVSDSALGVLADRFAEHRAHLLGVAYRLTGSLADAEDAVQESWLRLSTVDAAGIVDLRAWLTTVVGRICLDRLRSAQVRREHYVGPWLPEPIITPFGTPTSDDPLEHVVRADGVRMAAMVVLDRLTPEQRVAFVLHDAFAVPFHEIADTLHCSPAAARQHASRGRRAVGDAEPPPRAALEEQGEVIGRFLAAVVAGDLDAVVAVLHPDVVFTGDANGKARTARRELFGALQIARFALGLMRRYFGDRAGKAGEADVGWPVLVNGDLAIATAGGPTANPNITLDRRVTAFAVREGLIVAIYDVANPDKLGTLRT